ncbi:hypothetical protein SORBI_3002G101600 [Sorghum bicolor]|uniref:Uncharacterized protein n=1 Tax=Sorghum bicolor TaxID=4558 RepID=A0A1B6QAA5_SORBI|nr:hypothetical protein SORBI_3002G101600 [Sorghum bicolor]
MVCEPVTAQAAAGEAQRCRAGVGGAVGAPLASARVHPHMTSSCRPSGSAVSQRPCMHRRWAARHISILFLAVHKVVQIRKARTNPSDVLGEEIVRPNAISFL